jgi:hypothetical protein
MNLHRRGTRERGKTAIGDPGNSDQHVLARTRRWLPWIVLAILGLGPCLVCALVGPASVGSDLGLKAAPDWSRASFAGDGYYGRDSGAPLVVDGRGGVHLVWTRRLDAEQYDLHYTRLDDRGVVEDAHDLGLALSEPRRLRLIRDGTGLIHVVLLASSERDGVTSLFHLTLSEDGWPQSGPTLLSSGSAPCYEYDVATGAGGAIQLLWTEGEGTDRDLFHSTLSPPSWKATVPQLLTTGVSGPVVKRDGDERLHLLWEQPGHDEDTVELHYAVLTDGVVSSLSGTKLVDLPSGPRFFREGPVLAMDSEYGYLVWTVADRVDPDAQAISQAWYASFSLDSPSYVDARAFTLPMDERPAYVIHDSPYDYAYLAPLGSDSSDGSTRITGPFALDGRREAIVSFATMVNRGRGTESQIATAVFADGELVGYQLACNTRHWSRLPNLVSDSNGDLHLSWIDGLEPGPSAVYYASTSALVRDEMDRITREDLLSAALDTAFGTTLGMALIPFVVLWVAPSLIWATVVGRLLGETGGRSLAGYVGLAIAILIYQVAKFYFTPELLAYVPLSYSVPFLPAQAYVPLQVVVPVSTSGLSLTLVVYWLVRGRISGLPTACLAFVLLDAFLTAMVYGPALAIAG